jgi:hypothetical protein
MTRTLLSPSHIAAPVPSRYLTGDGYPPPTATVSAAFDHQNADHSYKTTVPILHTATQTNAAVVTQPSSLFETERSSAYTGAKSP